MRASPEAAGAPQEHAMLMYTSCGWFFDDISRIESIQILQYAGRAIALGEELSGLDTIEEEFLQILKDARSNDPEFGSGRDIYQTFVKPAMIARNNVAGQYAVHSLFDDSPERSEYYSYIVDRQFSKMVTSDKSKLAMGRCKITSKITHESSEAEYAVAYLGGGNISGRVRECLGSCAPQELVEKITGAFETNDLPAAFRFMDAYFGEAAFSLDSLFLDERLKVLETLLNAANAEMEASCLQAYETAAPLVPSLIKHGMEPPASFLIVADLVLRARLLPALQAEDLNSSQIVEILEEANLAVKLNKKELEDALRQVIEKQAKESHSNPGDLKSLRRFAAAVDLASKLSFDINYYQTQNIYYELLKNGYPPMKLAAEKGDKNAMVWIEEFQDLGKKLSVRVD